MQIFFIRSLFKSSLFCYKPKRTCVLLQYQNQTEGVLKITSVYKRAYKFRLNPKYASYLCGTSSLIISYEETN